LRGSVAVPARAIGLLRCCAARAGFAPALRALLLLAPRLSALALRLRALRRLSAWRCCALCLGALTHLLSALGLLLRARRRRWVAPWLGALTLRLDTLPVQFCAPVLLLGARRFGTLGPALGTLALFFGWRGPLLNARTGLDRCKGALLAQLVRPRLPIA
jgi:hypothetical protein